MLLCFNTEIFVFFQLFTQLMEFFTIQLEKLICNLFNTERIFQIIQCRMFRICHTINDKSFKSTDCCMAWFIFTYQIGISLCRSQVFRGFQTSVFDLHFIIETNKRQSPFWLAFCIESNKRSICIGVFNQLFGIATLSASGIFNISCILQLHCHNDDILFVWRFIISHMNGTFNMG